MQMQLTLWHLIKAFKASSSSKVSVNGNSGEVASRKILHGT